MQQVQSCMYEEGLIQPAGSDPGDTLVRSWVCTAAARCEKHCQPRVEHCLRYTDLAAKADIQEIMRCGIPAHGRDA